MPSPLSQVKRNIIDTLRQVPYFENFSNAEIFALVEEGHRQIAVPKQTICQEDDPGDAFYIVLDGEVEIISSRLHKFIATLSAGDIFGEIALLTGTARTATVRAVTDTKLFVVSRDDLQRLLVRHQELAEYIAQKLCDRQQMLIQLGVLTASDLKNAEETSLSLIRKRLQHLFGV